jgi:alkylation response protein AidB-like acyl-CoA dehydrogenase
MTTTTVQSATILAGVRALLPELRASAAVTDRDRRVPKEIIAALRDAGVYRMLLPEGLGGAPLDLQGFTDVVDLIAQGNAAAAWDIATSSMVTMSFLQLPREGTDHIFQGGPDVIFAGSMAGGRGSAVATDGGYRVTGRWAFGSGCQEAEWMLGSCDIVDGDSPRLGDDGRPRRVFAFFPAADITVHDTWQVVGLRGTGSHDWSVHEAFVPASRAVVQPGEPAWPGTLYRLSWPILASVHFSSVATGIARQAIDCFVDLAQHKTPTLERLVNYSQGLLRERVQVQEAVARAEALVESARAYRAAMVADVWATADAGEPVTRRQRAQLRLTGANAAACARQAIDLVFEAAGTTGIADASPLSRCFRDVHMVAQNIAIDAMNYAPVGQVLLGMEPTTPRF